MSPHYDELPAEIRYWLNYSKLGWDDHIVSNIYIACQMYPAAKVLDELKRMEFDILMAQKGFPAPRLPRP